MGRPKDRLWDHVAELKGGFKCNFCHRQFKGGMSRIKAHLAKVAGKDISVCTKVPHDVQREAYIAIGGPNKKAKGVPSTSNFENTKTTSTSSSSPSNTLHHSTALELYNKDKSAVDKLLAQHVVLNNIPIDVVQTASFSRFVQGVAEYGPGYRLPSESTIKTKLIPDLRMEVEEYIGNLKKSWATTGCTLMLDLWDDQMQGDFISIIAYSPKGAVFMKPFENPNNRKVELNLANIVCSVIEEIGSDHVVQFITNARKFELVRDEVVLKYPRTYNTPCAAHGIHLLLKNICEEVGWVKKVIDDANLIVTYMHKNTIISSLMRQHTNNKELKRPCMTRFASNFLMLQSIFDVGNELRSLVASSEWRKLDCNKDDMAKRVTGIIESTEFCSQGQEVLHVLKPLVRVLQLAESDGSTSGYLYEAMERAKGEIKQLCGNNQAKYKRLWELVEESPTRNIIHPIHAAAAFFNPAYLYSDNFRKDRKMDAGIELIHDRLVANEEKDNFLKEVQIYSIKESSLFTNMAIRMLKTSHPCMWWNFNGHKLPTLKKYAIRILSQPCSSSSCERNRSAFEAVRTKKTNRLALNLLDNLAYVRMNATLMEKFKMLEAQGTEPIDLDKLGELPEYADHEQDWEDDALDATDYDFDDDIMNDADPTWLDENSLYQMENIGESLVYDFLQQLLNKLTSPKLQEFVGQEKIHTELHKWKDFLWKICAVLDDAEEKQMADPEYSSSDVKIWVGELIDLAYHMEDILDEIGTEALRHKLMVEYQARSSNIQTLIPANSTALNPIIENFAYGVDDGTEDIGIEAWQPHLMFEPHASTSDVQTLIPDSSSGLNPSAINFNDNMGSKIAEITSMLQAIVRQIDDLNLTEKAEKRTNKLRGIPPTASLVDESHVYGREKDKEAILEMVLRDGNDDVVFVIPIIGMVGVGKTTLADLVYNDDKVKGCFHLKAWAYISEEFDIIRVTRTILQAVTSETYHLDDLYSIQAGLEELLSNKKFLFVLDGVWIENDFQWNLLCKPFTSGAPGSKIIVTTRNERVASMMGTISAYKLKELSDEDSLSLFVQHALHATNFDGHPNLKEIAEKIVKRCKGLPLAAKILGCLLSSELNCDVWEDILNSKIWKLPAEKSGNVPALRLSYHHLPSYLKRCFAYCAIFPKGYEFDKDELVLLWMGEGFLQEPKGKKHMKDLGLEYFFELLSRSFFHQSSCNKSRFVMNDLINDLAKSVAGEICFNLEGDTLDKSLDKVRHLAFNRSPYDASQRFEVIYQMKGLRTFLVLPVLVSGYDCLLSNKVLYDLLPKLKYLRVLSLSGYKIRELPDLIGDLKHLRYLNLSNSNIQQLPESLTALLNLQTLILRGCKRLIKLPEGIGNLTNLHHLDLIDTDDLDEMPSGIGNLASLQTLSKFVVGKDERLRVRDLENLSDLRGQLSILKLDNVVETQDAVVANLNEKQGLDELVLGWSNETKKHVEDSEQSDDDELEQSDDEVSEQSDDEVSEQNDNDEIHILDLLQPHRNLKKLTITSYGGTKFPSWIGDPIFSNLVQLNLHYCRKSTLSPSLGQLPSLKNLSIKGMNAVKAMGVEFYGGNSPSKVFPSLESLSFEDMLKWKVWSSSTAVEKFPCLRKLVLQNCPNLIKLPRHFVSLDNLYISRCPRLGNSIVRLPSLRELKIKKCYVVVLISLVDLTSVKTLKIVKISGLACLDTLVLEGFEVLEIEDCSELISLWEDGANFENLACLKKLIVKNCPVSLAGDEGALLPCNLEELELENCYKLEKLPNGLHSLTCLRSLSIKWCNKLVSFPATGLPYTLRP